MSEAEEPDIRMELKKFKNTKGKKGRTPVILISLLLPLSCLIVVILGKRTEKDMCQEIDKMGRSEEVVSIEKTVQKKIPVLTENPNPYFFPDDVDTVKYSRTLKSDLGESRIEGIEISVYREKAFSEGILCSLKNGVFKSRYFYVQKEKIYLIPDVEIRQDITEEELIETGTVICQPVSKQEEYFERDALGAHEFIKTADGKCAYYSYNDSQEGGFYEYFVWQIGKGLTEYRSGYRETTENGLYMEGVEQTGFVDHKSFNLYFFPDDSSTIKYDGVFQFFGMDPETGILESTEEEVELSVNKIKVFENGILYCMKIINDGKFYFDDSETGEHNRNRLEVGYFYVQADKIYLIRGIEIGSDITEDKLINAGQVICQAESMEDVLSRDEKGWHESIDVIGDRCHFSRYADYIETDWWEGFVWQKGLGLIEYRSGRGAGDSMIQIMMKL